MSNRQEDYMKIDLLRLLKALWRRAWVIVLSILLCGAIAFIYTYFFVTPLYQAHALLYVNINKSSTMVDGTAVSKSTTDLSSSRMLVNTYIVILNSRLTLNAVIEEAELDYDYEDLLGMISVAPINSTEIFSVTVTSPDPEEAERVANTIVRVLPEKAIEITGDSFISTVDYAVQPTEKSSPNITWNVGIGSAIGMLLGCGVIVLLDLLKQIREQTRDEEYQTQN